jgi:hypothetical protein
VIHDKTGSYNPKDDGYFKEGKKTSLYFKESKSQWCPIPPSQLLTDVNAEDKIDDDYNNNA